MKISELKPNINNPRKVADDKLDKLCRSIETFPEMMDKRPMVCVTDVDGKLYPLGGNMRLKALKKLGMKEIPDSWVVLADDWTEEKRKEFVIKDNVSIGEWNWDELQVNWQTEDLIEWGVPELPDFAAGLDVNDMTDDDVDIDADFDPIGTSTDLHKIVFIFDNELEAETFMSLNHKDQQYKKFGGGQGKIWQVNLSTTYGQK